MRASVKCIVCKMRLRWWEGVGVRGLIVGPPGAQRWARGWAHEPCSRKVAALNLHRATEGPS